MKPLNVICIALLLILLAFNISWGIGEINPRALGMGGAYSALARGLDSPDWNPANLGLSDNPRRTIGLLDFGLKLRNNSFSIADYNRYNGKFLNEADKNDIINSIPSSGLSLDLATQVSALNLSFGNLALTYKGVGIMSLSLDRDPLRLMLLGNAVVREVSVSDSRGEAFALGDLAFSYGRQIRCWHDGELSIGASAHYLQGFGYWGIINARGGVITTDTGFVGAGQMTYRESRGGHGYSSDLGLAVRFSGDWVFSADYQNILSKIAWGSGNRQFAMWFSMKPATVESILDESQSDSLVSSGDSSFACRGFSTKLTPAVRMGLAKKWKLITWSADWDLYLFDGPGATVSPRIANGLEYSRWNRFPLRLGFAFGGGQGATFSIGAGLRLGNFAFDLGLANPGTPIPTRGKGASMAFGACLQF